MRNLSRRLRGLLIAIVAVAMSAGLAFGAEPPASASYGLANAASHAGKTVPVAGGSIETAGDEDADEDEETDEGEDTDEGEESEGDEEAEGDEESREAGDNCLTDPSFLTEEQLAAMNHGSIVCWAAHQEAWPEDFKNHGAWVSSWAHAGKGQDTSATAKGNGKGNAKGKGKGNQGE